MLPDYNFYKDAELLRLLSADNEPALKELYERYWEPLFTKAFHFLGSEDAAKDCVQDVFIWLWQHRKTLLIENPAHYLRQAVRFQAFRALKKQKAARDFHERLERWNPGPQQVDPLDLKEMKTTLEQLVAALPHDQQLIFRLHREQAMTYRQIAVERGISIKTVEKKMSLALKQLRAGLKEALVLGLLAQLFR